MLDAGRVDHLPDKILFQVSKMSSVELQTLIQGREGTPVKLSIERHSALDGLGVAYPRRMVSGACSRLICTPLLVHNASVKTRGPRVNTSSVMMQDVTVLREHVKGEAHEGPQMQGTIAFQKQKEPQPLGNGDHYTALFVFNHVSINVISLCRVRKGA
jgi:hypothetical protein